MTHELSWEDLLQELERIKTLGSPEAVWFAYVGREDSGIWLLYPHDPRREERRSSFGLFAAHAIDKLGIRPVAVPQTLEFCPHWPTICAVDEKLARRQEKSVDLSDAVPHGLGGIDDDTVDPCTRAWLERLRSESSAFRITTRGTDVIRGTKYERLSGTIEDVCTASMAYVKRCARDEIGSRLSTGRRPIPRELIDVAKRSGGFYSYERLAKHIGIGKDTLYAITGETKWVSDESYALVAQTCRCRPEDLQPRDLPPPKRHRRK